MGSSTADEGVQPGFPLAGCISQYTPVSPDTQQGPEKDKEMEDVSEEVVCEEVRAPVTVRNPLNPTRKEIEEHEVTHIPFRSWCKHCIRGRAVNTPHKTKKKTEEDEEGKLPKISMDYGFMG